jgi:CRISPR-associated protein Csm3
MREQLDDELTEVKSENAIDRITSQANPRTLERVPAGAKFRVRMVIDILRDEDKRLIPLVVQGMRLLEDAALGGGGSRGSGRVEFQTIRVVWRSRGYYAEGAAEQEVAKAENAESLQQAVLADEFALRLSE